MRKQTAPKSRPGRSVAPTQTSGLIARGKSSPQSGTAECALDNHSHRTPLRMTCERTARRLARKLNDPKPPARAQPNDFL
jgi:hypothetical protein